VPLLPAQDHKRVGDGDTGPNTGGMGAYTPLPWLPQSMVDRIVDEVCKPVAAELTKRGTPFSGLLYAGLAIDDEGPAVVEFNCRFGDPETQGVLELLESPLGAALAATARGTLADLPALQWHPGAAVVVVLAAENYPGRPRTGDPIVGSGAEGVLHAGTKLNNKGEVVSSGGRVLSVVGRGADLKAARAQAYERLAGIKLVGAHFRTDIGKAAEDGQISL
ncbi:MAG: phosphoribosylglycinamide synthetase C domain-containing protein, partial [Gordonia sp. (in: high G+C Gram-positive bacteria)]